MDHTQYRRNLWREYFIREHEQTTFPNYSRNPGNDQSTQSRTSNDINAYILGAENSQLHNFDWLRGLTAHLLYTCFQFALVINVRIIINIIIIYRWEIISQWRDN